MSEPDAASVSRTAEFFKALSTPARILILHHLHEPRAVGELARLTGLSQPLVSQHLRVLRGAAIVSVDRRGREAIYSIADRHVGHVLADALAHADEEPEHRPPQPA